MTAQELPVSWLLFDVLETFNAEFWFLSGVMQVLFHAGGDGWSAQMMGDGC